MKCLKSTKTGKIIRVSNEDANLASREWKFISKSEWKADRQTNKHSEKVVVEVQEQTISEKQLNKKKKDK